MTMAEVANAIEVHETTVSRAIANKYLKTPHGTFPFKYFFTPGYSGKDGGTVSNIRSGNHWWHHRGRKSRKATE